MDRDILTRTITESVVDRCIREIEEDPKRSVRKLVDLGRQLARGRFQRQYLDLTQKMLEDEESGTMHIAKFETHGRSQPEFEDSFLDSNYEGCEDGI